MRTFSFFRLLTLVSLTAALLAAPAAQAQTFRRVNNTGITGTGIFSSLQAAHDAAASGDVIYVEPSGISYGTLECTKPLTIIGNGYFLNEQSPALTVDVRASIVDVINLRPAAVGSRVTGITSNGGRIVVQANNCTVERCRLINGNGLNIGSDPFSGGTVTITNGILRQNFIEAALNFNVSAGSPISGVLISNNFIRDNIQGGNSSSLNNVVLSNNVIGSVNGGGGGGIDIDNALLINNIITVAGASFATRSNTFNNNIGAGTQFGTANGNQQNVAPGTVFVGSGGTDARFQIVAGGPADNTGEGGVDVGMFGGNVPYVIGGIPNVPTIFQYGQSISGTTLNATISTRSNK